MEVVEEVEKVEAVKLQLGELMLLVQLLPAFKTPTYGDGKLIEGILKTIEAFDQSAITKEVFEKYGVSAGEVIDNKHPFFFAINTECMAAGTDLTKADIAAFDLDLFIKLTDGLNINYRERTTLERLLVK